MEAYNTGDYYIRTLKILDGALHPVQAYADRLNGKIKYQRKSRTKMMNGNSMRVEMLGQALWVPTLNPCLTASSHNWSTCSSFASSFNRV